MVNQQLVDWIKGEEAQGYTPQQLYQYLCQQGYDPNEVWEAIQYASQVPLAASQQPVVSSTDKKPSSNMKLILIVVAAIFIIGIVAASFWYFTRPVCGNGEIEEGETYLTCCFDAGCLGDQTCEDNACFEPVCSECQYLQNHKCWDYMCCNNEQCANGEICENHICSALNCGECQYAMDHVCVDYFCCKDFDCDDNNSSTTDICLNPKTTDANCSNTLADTCKDDDDCYDDEPSTRDICSGIPKKCSNIKITECINGDGYCPSACLPSVDDDCMADAIVCAASLNCFIEASKTCSPSNMLYTSTTEEYGMLKTALNHMELRGLEQERCIFYQRNENTTITFTNAKIQQLLDVGVTQEKIDEQEQVANDAAKFAIGLETTCRFAPSNLTAMLIRWQDGNLSSADLAGPECGG